MGSSAVSLCVLIFPSFDSGFLERASRIVTRNREYDNLKADTSHVRASKILYSAIVKCDYTRFAFLLLHGCLQQGIFFDDSLEIHIHYKSEKNSSSSHTIGPSIISCNVLFIFYTHRNATFVVSNIS